MRHILFITLVAVIAAACGSKQKASVTTPVDRPGPGGEGTTSRAEPETSTQQQPVADDGSTRRFGPIYFAYDQDVLDQRAGDTLAEVAAYLEKNAGAVAVLEGHADERGTPEYNIALGDRRAQSCRTFLRRLGVAEGRLQALSYGEEQPAVEGENEEAWSKNRRVEIVIKRR